MVYDQKHITNELLQESWRCHKLDHQSTRFVQAFNHRRHIHHYNLHTLNKQYTSCTIELVHYNFILQVCQNSLGSSIQDCPPNAGKPKKIQATKALHFFRPLFLNLNTQPYLYFFQSQYIVAFYFSIGWSLITKGTRCNIYTPLKFCIRSFVDFFPFHIISYSHYSIKVIELD